MTALRLALFCIGLVPAVILGFAVSPMGDLARLLLAANGSMLRGIGIATAIAVVCLGLAAWIGAERKPGRWPLSWMLAGCVLTLGATNAWMWLHGMERRAIGFRSDGVELQGTLMLPATAGPHPAVVIVHGSARLGRDFYAVWGRELVKSGIAVLVYDKRGTGASGGDIPQNNNDAAYLIQLGNDAAHAVDALSRQQQIDSARIGLLGLSQGGWTVPVAARLRPQVKRIALLSGPVASVGEEMAFSEAAEGANGSRAEDLARIALGDAAAESAGASGFTPIPDLNALRCEAIWLFGDRDRQIPVKLSRMHLQRLSEDGLPFSSRLLPDADHLLLDRNRFPPVFHAQVTTTLAAWFSGEPGNH
jgi:uncharacterized protein